jgi:hypothetical protein
MRIPDGVLVVEHSIEVARVCCRGHPFSLLTSQDVGYSQNS